MYSYFWLIYTCICYGVEKGKERNRKFYRYFIRIKKIDCSFWFPLNNLKINKKKLEIIIFFMNVIQLFFSYILFLKGIVLKSGSLVNIGSIGDTLEVCSLSWVSSLRHCSPSHPHKHNTFWDVFIVIPIVVIFFLTPSQINGVRVRSRIRVRVPL